MKKFFSLMKHPLFSGSIIMVIGSNSISFLNLLFHFAMGKMLSPSNYGEVATIISLAGLLAVIPAALNLVVTKHISDAKSDLERGTLINWLKTKVFLVSLILSFIIAVASPILSSFLHLDKVLYLILLAISFFFSVQSLLNRSILQGLLKFKEMIISMLVESGFKLVICAFLVYLGFQVGGVMIGFLISVVLSWYISNSYLHSYSKKTDTKIELKQLLLFTIPVFIQSIAMTSLYSSDLVLVKHFFSSHDAGLYAALSTISKIILFGAGPIGAVMFPLVSQRSSQGSEYRRIIFYSFFITLTFAIFMLIIYCFLPRLTISLLYGASYLEGSSLLILFGVFITFLTLSSLLISFHLSLNRGEVVVLPAIAAIAQIIVIWLYHTSLFTIIIISLSISALLLILLLIYSSYEKSRPRNKSNINYSASI